MSMIMDNLIHQIRLAMHFLIGMVYSTAGLNTSVKVLET